MQALREKRTKLIADMRALLDRVESEKRAITTEEQASFDAMRAEADALQQTLRRADDLATEERAIVPESQRTERILDLTGGNRQAADYSDVLTRYLRYGERGLNPAQMDVLQRGWTQFETREQNTYSGAAGGFVVAPDTSMYGQIVEARKLFGGMRAVASVLTTATGADLPIPTDDDTANSGAIIAEEGSHASGTSVALGQKVLHAYAFSSKIVKVSWQLLQDSSIDFEAFLGRKLGMRIERALNTYCTTGTGVGQPQGVVTGCTVGRTGATGTATSVTADDLLRTVHSVDVAYRSGGSVRWMFSDTTALALRLLKDGDGQYIWRPGLTEAQPDRLLGYPIQINNDMATMAANAQAILFGDFAYYYIRDVRDVVIVRLAELYAANGQVGFVAFSRHDGGLIDAGQNPIKSFKNSAS